MSGITMKMAKIVLGDEEQYARDLLRPSHGGDQLRTVMNECLSREAQYVHLALDPVRSRKLFHDHYLSVDYNLSTMTYEERREKRNEVLNTRDPHLIFHYNALIALIDKFVAITEDEEGEYLKSLWRKLKDLRLEDCVAVAIPCGEQFTDYFKADLLTDFIRGQSKKTRAKWSETMAA